MKRRDFLKIVVGGTAISFGAEVERFRYLIPFMAPPENTVPGVATWYATSCRECPAGCGLLTRNRELRPVKVEGNPLHPINGGKTCPRGQAILQGLYDPDRLRKPVAGKTGQTADWNHALSEIGRALAPLRDAPGQVAVISDLEAGSLADLIADWLGAFQSTRYLVYEPFNYEALREGNRLVFGRAEIPDYHFERADLIVSLAADFLETWVSPVKLIRRFADTRNPDRPGMSKFVYIGPRLSQTAMSADEVVLVPPGMERDVALAILNASGRPGAPPEFTPQRVSQVTGVPADGIRRIAQRFARARNPLVVGGAVGARGLSAVESAAAAALLTLAAGGTTIDFGRVHALSQTAREADLAAFVHALGSAQVKALVVVHANPAYALSPQYRFAEALKQVPLVVAITPFYDETAHLADWVLPASHPLESWGDYSPETGITNLMQPVIGTRYQTRMAGDILLNLMQVAGATPQNLHHTGLKEVLARTRGGSGGYLTYLQARWATRGAGGTGPAGTALSGWQGLLQQGGDWPAAPSTTIPIISRASYPGPPVRFSPPAARQDTSLWLHPMPLLYDGRSANERWLQEVQDPVTHAVWGSWIEVHPKTAGRLKLRSHQVVELATAAGSTKAPLFLYNGVAEDTFVLGFGQGHTAYGRYAAGRGANAFALMESRPSDAGPFPTVRIGGTPGEEAIVTTDGSWSQHGRRLAEALPLSEAAHARGEDIDWPTPAGYDPMQNLYAPHPHRDHRWAMVVDLSRCVGCETCMVACHAENNIGVVGKEWIAQGREMYWLRITRYFDWDHPQPARFLPVLCQHCDAAPCEPVCPVFAAAHNDEGLNMQVYNRCIGTRYCNNNCPWKVRRFNWRNYDWPEELTWQLNPDVTVRVRGVMEKCSFCIQRIRDVEHRAKREQRPVRDGEITPACAQACPASVFTFGDLLDRNSQVHRLFRDNPRRYQVLRDLNTKPGIVYLKKVFNDES